MVTEPDPLWVDYVPTGRALPFIPLGFDTLVCAANYNRQHFEPIEDEL